MEVTVDGDVAASRFGAVRVQDCEHFLVEHQARPGDDLALPRRKVAALGDEVNFARVLTTTAQRPARWHLAA